MCILVGVMNENSSNTSAPHHGLTAEAISRRAYELWEQEGRPESRDLHHWLRAEKELLAEQGKSGGQANAAPSNTDQPLQARPSTATSRPPTSKKSGSASPFDQKGTARSTQPGMRTGRM